jgi:hypothetical protein
MQITNSSLVPSIPRDMLALIENGRLISTKSDRSHSILLMKGSTLLPMSEVDGAGIEWPSQGVPFKQMFSQGLSDCTRLTDLSAVFRVLLYGCAEPIAPPSMESARKQGF